MVEPRDRDISDHTPLVLNTGASTHHSGQRPFKFEREWLIRNDFYDMVASICGNQKRLDVLLWRGGRIKFIGSDNIFEAGPSIQ